MKIIMEDVTVMYPNEKNGVSRVLTTKNDGEFLNLHLLGAEENDAATITLTKTEVMILRDHFNTILKNKLLDK